VPDQRTYGDDWDIHAGPDRIIPPWNPDESVAWVWTLRKRTTGQLKELVVTVTWRGFDSIDDVPSELAKQGFADKGRTGVDYHLAEPMIRPFEDGWTTMILHSQTRTIHGSWRPPTGIPPEIKRINDPD
jgi:hypothetical protein